VTWAHAIAAVINDPTGEKCIGPQPLGFMIIDLLVQLDLDSIEY